MMKRVHHLIRLRKALRRSPLFTLHRRTEAYRQWDVCFSMSGGIAFVQVLAPEHHLYDVWHMAQTRIASFRDTHFREGRLPDLYLILVQLGTVDFQDATVQQIVGDPYICRKVVLEWKEHQSAEELLALMPFSPLQLPDAAVADVPPVALALGELGYNPEWVQSLLSAGHGTGVNSLAERLEKRTLTIKARDLPKPLPKLDQPRPVPARNKIKRLIIEGFRGYSSPQTFNLDANLVVIYAPNGTGKTSLCEAIEWAMTGEVERVKKPGLDAPDDAYPPLVNLESEFARVELEMEPPAKPGRILQYFNSRTKEERWEIDGLKVVVDKEAVTRTLNVRVPRSQSAAWIRNAFHHSHFLTQNSMQSMVKQVTPDTRYQLYQMLMGTVDYSVTRERTIAVEGALAALVRQRQEELQRLTGEHQTLKKELESAETKAGDAIAKAAGRSLQEIADQLWGKTLELGIIPVAAVHPQDPIAVAEVLSQPLEAEVRKAQQWSQVLSALPAQVEEAHRLIAQVQSATDVLVRTQAMQEETQSKRDALDAQIRARTQEQAALLNRLGELRVRGDRLKRYATAAPRLAQIDAAIAQLEHLRQGERRLNEALAAQDAAHLALDEENAFAQVRIRISEEQPRFEQLTHELETSVLEQTELEARSQEVDAQLEQLKGVLSQRQQLLSALQSHLHDEKCPLCGTAFPGSVSLGEAVASTLATVPQAAVALENERQKLRDRLGTLNSELAGLRSLQTSVQEKLNELRRTAAAHETRLADHRQVIERVHGPIDTNLTILAIRMAVAVKAAQRELANLAYDRESVAQTLSNLLIAEGESGENLAPDVLLQQSRQVSGRLRSELEALDLSDEERQAASERLGELTADLSRREAGATASQEQLRLLESERAQLANLLSELERRVSDRAAEIDQQRQSLKRLEADTSSVGLPFPPQLQQVESAKDSVIRRLARLQDANGDLGLIRAFGRIVEARSSTGEQIKRLTSKIDQKQGEIHHLQSVVEGCKQFRQDVLAVSSKLEQEREQVYLPTINRIYQRLAAHPFFGDLKLNMVADASTGEFRVQVARKGETTPAGGVSDFFSMAQMNVVALSMFLTKGLLQGWSSLSTIMLDDPVQHLDDMNTYSFLDLLQTIASMDRQIIVTTCHRDLYKLMLVKFSFLNTRGVQRFKALRLLGIGKAGPELFDDTSLVSEG